jgi:hypothetical protein
MNSSELGLWMLEPLPGIAAAFLLVPTWDPLVLDLVGPPRALVRVGEESYSVQTKTRGTRSGPLARRCSAR